MPNKNIYFLNVKFRDKTFVVPIFYVFRTGEIYKTQNKSYYMSLDNTCKTIEAFQNSFGFINNPRWTGIKKKNLDAYDLKMLQQADELHNYLVENKIMTEEEYKSLNADNKTGETNLRLLRNNPTKFFNYLNKNLDIEPFNFVGKADRDPDGAFVSTKKKTEKEGLLDFLARLYGENEFDFLSHKRFLEKHVGIDDDTEFLRVLFPEVRERESGEDYKLSEEPETVENQGHFTEGGKYITKNLLKLFFKGKAEIIEKNDEEKNFNAGYSVITQKISNELDNFKDCDQNKIEKIISEIKPLPKDFNEFYSKIRSEVEKLSGFDLDGIKLTPNEIENELRLAYFSSKPDEISNDLLWSTLYSAIGNLFTKKYLGAENDIYGYDSDSNENRFDLIHRFQCIAYYFMSDMCEKIRECESQGKLNDGLEKLKPKLKKLDNIIHMIYDKKLSGEFDNFLKRLSEYKGTAFDFLIDEVYDGDILKEDIDKIKASADYLASTLNDKNLVGVTSLNMFVMDKTKKIKLKDGIMLPDGLAFPVTKLLGEETPFYYKIDSKDNKIVCLIEKLSEIEISPDQMSLNIDMDQVYEQSSPEQKEIIKNLYSEYGDYEKCLEENHIYKLITEIEEDYKKSKVNDEKVEKLKFYLKKYINCLSEADKLTFEKYIDNTKPNFLGVVWQLIKQFFVPSKKVNLSNLRKLREADNLLGVNQSIKKSIDDKTK